MKPTALYRHYDADGALLYVGISVSAPARLAQHVGGSHWSQDIRRVEVEMHPARFDAEMAEWRAICSEAPRHNLDAGRPSGKPPTPHKQQRCEDAQKLIDALSIEAVSAAVGVDRRTVTNRARGALPAYWWLAVSTLARERGVDCPASAFAFARSGVGEPQPGDAA